MDPRHFRTLELPKILERLAARASFSAGAEKARDLTPSPLIQEVRERLETTAEARRLLEARPQTSLGGVRDVRPKAAAARRGAVLLSGDLLDVRDTLVAARSLQQTLTRLERQFPYLADVAGRIAYCPDLIDAIGRCLDERGEVRDDASPELDNSGPSRGGTRQACSRPSTQKRDTWRIPLGVLVQMASSPLRGSRTNANWAGPAKKFCWINMSISENSTPKPGCEWYQAAI